jgi:predicted DNA-binding transcriptional regulator AlpA
MSQVENVYAGPCIPEPYFTVANLTGMLQVTRRTISRWCGSNKFPRPVKVGGSNRWKAQSVLTFLDQLE